MLELLVLLLLVVAAGGIAVIVAGFVVGVVVAVCVAILLVALAILGFVGKIVLFPLTALLWLMFHPLLTILLIGLFYLVLRDRRRSAI